MATAHMMMTHTTWLGRRLAAVTVSVARSLVWLAHMTVRVARSLVRLAHMMMAHTTVMLGRRLATWPRQPTVVTAIVGYHRQRGWVNGDNSASTRCSVHRKSVVAMVINGGRSGHSVAMVILPLVMAMARSSVWLANTHDLRRSRC